MIFVARSRVCVCGGFMREIVLERLCDIESYNERLKGRQESKQVQLVRFGLNDFREINFNITRLVD